MVMRLSELLERIRPAGAPGASFEGEQQRRRDEIEETADLAAVLERFEAEADAAEADAREQAEQIRERADRQAEQIRRGLADRRATARASGAREHERRGETELAQIADDTTREVDRLRARASVELERWVAEALDVIWGLIPPGSSAGNPR